jgi:hypothetical protein
MAANDLQINLLLITSRIQLYFLLPVPSIKIFPQFLKVFNIIDITICCYTLNYRQDNKVILSYFRICFYTSTPYYALIKLLYLSVQYLQD